MFAFFAFSPASRMRRVGYGSGGTAGATRKSASYSGGGLLFRFKLGATQGKLRYDPISTGPGALTALVLSSGLCA